MGVRIAEVKMTPSRFPPKPVPEDEGAVMGVDVVGPLPESAVVCGPDPLAYPDGVSVGPVFGPEETTGCDPPALGALGAIPPYSTGFPPPERCATLT